LLGKDVDVEVDAYTANHLVELIPEAGIPMPSPLISVGRSTLHILAKVGGNVVDSISLDVDIGPSQVKDLNYEIRDGRTFLRWAPVPEGDMWYEVYRVLGKPEEKPRLYGKTRELEWEVLPQDISRTSLKRRYRIPRKHQPSESGSPPKSRGALPRPIHSVQPESPDGDNINTRFIGTSWRRMTWLLTTSSDLRRIRLRCCGWAKRCHLQSLEN
jgi:hypothetical protein